MKKSCIGANGIISLKDLNERHYAETHIQGYLLTQGENKDAQDGDIAMNSEIINNTIIDIIRKPIDAIKAICILCKMPFKGINFDE